MDRDVRKGHIEIDFPVEPFVSIGKVLSRSTRLLLDNLPFVAEVTLVVLLPAKLLLQFAGYLFDVPADGVLSYVVMDLGDLVFTALVIPAVIYGLVGNLRTGQPPRLGEALRWGRRQWGKTLWNKLKVEITIMLWSALLVVPGVAAMIKLIFVDTVVAVEADRESEPLRRSRALTEGSRWRIFLALLPALPLSVAHTYATFRSLQFSPWLMVPVDSLFGVLDQWMTVVVLMMYLGLIEPRSSQGSKSKVFGSSGR